MRCRDYYCKQIVQGAPSSSHCDVSVWLMFAKDTVVIGFLLFRLEGEISLIR